MKTLNISFPRVGIETTIYRESRSRSEASGAPQSVPVNRLVLGSISTREDEIFIYIYIFISSLWCRGENAALSSATQHAMSPEIGGKWGTECLNTRFRSGH